MCSCPLTRIVEPAKFEVTLYRMVEPVVLAVAVKVSVTGL